MEPDVQPEGRIRVGDRPVKRGDAEVRGADAQSRTGGGEHERLGEELPNDGGARRAERRPNADFLGPVCRPIQQQIGDVGAGNQQHEEDGAKHGVQHPPRLGAELAVDEVHHRRAHSLALLFVLARDALGDGIDVGIRGVDRDVRL